LQKKLVGFFKVTNPEGDEAIEQIAKELYDQMKKPQKKTRKAKDVSVLFSYISYFENLKTGEGYSVTKTSEKDGVVYYLPNYQFDKKVKEFEQTVYDLDFIDHDYQATLEKAGFYACQDRNQWVLKSDCTALKAVLTYCLRGERFCTGFLASILDSKLLVSILKRLKELETSN